MQSSSLKLLLLSALLWPSAALADESPPQLDFDAIREFASELPDLRSLLISQNGEIIFEEYYAGWEPWQATNTKSASKSIMSALVGIAIDRGYIESVDQPIVDFFPELEGEDVADQKRTITVENLLTMQAGLESTSSRNYGRWVISDNWVEFALNQPLTAEPGTSMIYSTGSTHLLSAIIERASGMSTRAFAQQYLASPMNFRLAYWSQDPQGIYFGGNDLEITPRQMLAFGQLYLDDGMYRDERILPSEWIRRSYEPHAVSPRGEGRYYGYGWYLRELGGQLVPTAWGYGGQMIFVLQELDMVVVMTSNSDPRPNRRRHLRRLNELMENYILPNSLETRRMEARVTEAISTGCTDNCQPDGTGEQ